VLQKDADSFEIELEDLLKRFFMHPPSPIDVSKVASLRTNAFIGLTKSNRNGKPVCFTVLNTDRSSRIDWLTKKDPSFVDRLLEVYRVEGSKWESKIEEEVST
jgi:hypothetical protein